MRLSTAPVSLDTACVTQIMGKRRKSYRVRLTDESSGETVFADFNSQDLARQTLTAFEGHTRALDRASRGLNRKSDTDWLKIMLAAAKEFPSTVGKNHAFSTVLIAMCGDVAYGGRIKMRKDQIAETAGVSIRTAERAIKHLIDVGLITTGIHENREYLFIAEKLGIRGYKELKDTKAIAKEERQRASGVKLKLLKGGKAA